MSIGLQLCGIQRLENQENVQFLVHVKDSEGSSFSWALERQHEIADFADKSVFCDETHFHLDGLDNRGNCRI